MSLQLPEIRQQNDWSCGQALFRSICEFWKVKSKPFDQLANPYSGLSPDSFEAALRAVGLSVFSGTLSVDLLGRITKGGLPVACLIEEAGEGHWSGVESVGPSKIRVWCPLNGRLQIPISVWEKNWLCSHYLGGVFERWGIVAHKL